MEKFGSFCDWRQDQNLSKSKDEECCYPYHLISNCIYQQKTKTTQNCQVKHSIQSESMIYLSCVDKLIQKNRLKMKKRLINNNNDKNFSIHEKDTKHSKMLKKYKLSKNKKLLPIKDKLVNDERQKKKINWSEHFTERRKSRRLSNQTPIDVKKEFKKYNLNSTHDLVLLGLISNKRKRNIKFKNELIKNTDLEYSIHQKSSEKYLFQVTNEKNTNIAPINDIVFDKYQNENSVSIEENTNSNPVSILNNDISNNFLKSSIYTFFENKFSESHSYITSENCITLQSISNPVLDQTFNDSSTFSFSEDKFACSNNKTVNSDTKNINPVYKLTQANTFNMTENAVISVDVSSIEGINIKQKNIHDNINTHCKVLNYFKPLDHKSLSCKPSEKKLMLSTFNKEEKSILSNKIKEKAPDSINGASLQKMFNEEAETKTAPILPETVLENRGSKMTSCLVKTCSEIETEEISSQHKTYFEAMQTKKPASPFEGCSEINQSERVSSLQQISTKKEFLPGQETFSEIKVTEKVSSPNKPISQITKFNDALILEEPHSKIIETVDALSLQETFSGLNKIEKIPSPCKPCTRITKEENMPCLQDTFSNITVTEKVTCPPKEYSKVAEIENKPNQLDLFSKKVKSNRPSILRKCSKRTVYKSDTLIIDSNDTLGFKHQPQIHSEIIMKDKTSQLKPKSNTNIIPKNSPTLTNVNSEFTVIDNSLLPKIYSEQTVEDCQVPSEKYPEMVTMNQLIEQKNNLKIMEVEKKLYRDKLYFVNSLGLFSMEQFDEVCQIKKKKASSTNSIQKFPFFKILNEDYTDMVQTYNSLTSTEDLKCSNQIKDQNHISTPILLSEKSSRLLFRSDHKCLDKCSYCHKKIHLLDSIRHLSQIKSYRKQNACLKNISNSIGPDSCLCIVCFENLVNQNLKNIVSICAVLNCEQTVVYERTFPSLNKIKNLLFFKGISFRSGVNKKQKMHVCDFHHNQILDIVQCHLCGNRTLHKFEVYQSEVPVFQSILNEDKVPVTVKYDSFICKPCRVYLIWKTSKNSNTFGYQLSDLVYHRETVLRRIFEYNKLKYQPKSKKNSEETWKEKINTQLQKNKEHSTSFSSLMLTENNKTYHTTTLAVNQELKACDVKKPSTTRIVLDSNPMSSTQLDLNIATNLPSLTSFSESKNTQIKRGNEYANFLNITSKIFRIMYRKYSPDALNLIKHLIFVEKNRLMGNLQLTDDTVKQHHITLSNDHSSLLHQESSYLNHYHSESISENYKTIPKSNNVDVNQCNTMSLKNAAKYNFVKYNDNNDNRKLKTVKKLQFIECSTLLKNHLKYNESSSHIFDKNITLKSINHSLSTVSENNVSKIPKYPSTNATTSFITSIVTSTNIITDTSASFIPYTVKTPAITNTTISRTTPIIFATTATTATPVYQKFVNILPRKSIMMKGMNLHHNRISIFKNQNIINRNPNISQNNLIMASMPRNMVSHTPSINIRRILKHGNLEQLT